MKTLHIDIVDKIAIYQQRDGDIVCGNNDYQIEFTFDREWEDYPDRTARFVWNNQHYDIPFSGNICRVPRLYNTLSVLVGVYAGDLETTTGAEIKCKASILCGTTTQHEGADEAYIDEVRRLAEEASQSAREAREAAEELKYLVSELEAKIEASVDEPNDTLIFTQ